MLEFLDQIGRRVLVPAHPRRIISLCPSITETLIALGLQGQVVGRTHFCIHPSNQVKSITRVGGTKNVKLDRIHALEPDLIIAEKEENIREQVEEMARHWPVYVTDVRDVPSAVAMIREVGKICGKSAEGESMARQARTAFADLKPILSGKRVAYFIWREPWMLVGGDTYIQDLLQRIGLENIALSLEGRYPEASETQLLQLKPDLVLLSSEPYPFGEAHRDELQKLMPQADIRLVDGEMFSWYGVRMIQAADYLRTFQQEVQAFEK